MTNIDKDVKKKYTLVHFWWECKLIATIGISMEFLKKNKYKTNKTYMISQSHFWVYIQRKQKICCKEIYSLPRLFQYYSQ